MSAQETKCQKDAQQASQNYSEMGPWFCTSRIVCRPLSNLAAQSAEQIGLAAAPLIAVLVFGAGEGAIGILQTAQTLPFLLLSIQIGAAGAAAALRRPAVLQE